MKKTVLVILILLLLSISISGCLGFTKNLSGEVVIKEFDSNIVDNAKALVIKNIQVVNDKVEVLVKYSEIPYLKITAQSSFFEELSVTNPKIGAKKIEIKGAKWNRYVTNDAIVIEIGLKNINEIDLSSCKGEVEGRVFEGNAKIDLSGDSAINISTINCDKFGCDTSGSSQVKFEKIYCNDINFDCSGCSKISIDEANDINDGDFDIELSGHSKVIVNNICFNKVSIELSGDSNLEICNLIDCSDLDIDASGESNISIKGITQNISVDLSGSSKVKAFDLISDIVNIKTSGTSEIQITVNGKLNVEASGSSIVKYKGKPALGKISTSGSSLIVGVE